MPFPVHQGTVTCKSLLAKHNWEQFQEERNRWHLAEKWSKLQLEELISEPAEIFTHHTIVSSEKILVLRFVDGGVISYQREELFLHTLNTLKVFKRKLWDLGLWTPGDE